MTSEYSVNWVRVRVRVTVRVTVRVRPLVRKQATDTSHSQWRGQLVIKWLI